MVKNRNPSAELYYAFMEDRNLSFSGIAHAEDNFVYEFLIPADRTVSLSNIRYYSHSPKNQSMIRQFHQGKKSQGFRLIKPPNAFQSANEYALFAAIKNAFIVAMRQYENKPEKADLFSTLNLIFRALRKSYEADFNLGYGSLSAIKDELNHIKNSDWF